MNESVLLSDDAGAVRTLTMNRPDKLNALSQELTGALTTAILAADADEAVKAIVLTGAGRAFCAGADLGEAQRLNPGVADRVSERASMAMDLQLAFQKTNKPVIAAVRGYAIAGGCGLALACDLVVAADNAKFGYPEIKRGIVAAVVMANLARQVGTKAAFELLIRGEHIDANRALRLGMINTVVAAEQVLPEAQRIAAELADLPQQALRMTKQLFYRVLDLPFAEAMQAGKESNAAMRGFERDPSMARFAKKD
jgi:enoyl-CoA hydratase/carnithine racemase